MKKKLRFKRGTDKIYIPFLLSNSVSWKEQVMQEKQDLVAAYDIPKSASIGFEITDYGAAIILRKC